MTMTLRPRPGLQALAKVRGIHGHRHPRLRQLPPTIPLAEEEILVVGVPPVDGTEVAIRRVIAEALAGLPIEYSPRMRQRMQ